ncbi:aldehyde dehydrogenase family protein [candidate division KSB1 bacterium]|nr:aldehyde dehydrogenase [candidate division KSB1 bacterium]RQW02818.1 MAG: aldehyde dehydrogenase family protein [candidate division KSB1 bacterium]
MNFDQEFIEKIVGRVMSELQNSDTRKPSILATPENGIFDSVESAIAATAVAQQQWVRITKETKAAVIQALRAVMHQYAEDFAQRALQETGMGRLEDKIFKHHNVADVTPGLEDLETKSWTGDKGLVVEDWAPYGVIAAVTPSTHPIPVMFNSTIIMIAPGNGIVFNVHPAAKNVSAYALEIFSKTIQQHGGPANLISMIKEPTLESAKQLFNHPVIPMIVATGGPGPVKAAFEAGKKVIAAGPGNPPVLVDETADLNDAARYIIEGAGFDNNIICIAEKEVFVVESVTNAFMKAMASHGAVQLNAAQISTLTEKAIRMEKPGDYFASRDYIGKNANVLARAVGLHIGDDVRLLYGHTDFDHPFVQTEQMMPFIPVVPVKDVEEGIELAYQAEHQFGHTAIIHSNSMKNITAFTQKMNTDIVAVNGPSLAGLGPRAGEAYFSHTLASPTGEGVCTPRNFARVRRLAIYKSLHIV